MGELVRGCLVGRPRGRVERPVGSSDVLSGVFRRGVLQGKGQRGLLVAQDEDLRLELCHPQRFAMN